MEQAYLICAGEVTVPRRDQYGPGRDVLPTRMKTGFRPRRANKIFFIYIYGLE